MFISVECAVLSCLCNYLRLDSLHLMPSQLKIRHLIQAVLLELTVVNVGGRHLHRWVFFK